MKKREYRALASLCRQHAAYDPDKSWHLLGQAKRWKHFAEQASSGPVAITGTDFPEGGNVNDVIRTVAGLPERYRARAL
jgi:hypothetical protein